MRLRRGKTDADPRSGLPELMIKALDSLDSFSLVILPGEVIAYQSANLDSLGITKDGRVMSEDLISLIRAVRRTGEIAHQSIEIARGPIGVGRRELRITLNPLNEDGMVLVLISDESEARRIDAVRRDFVANVSHELKTPIGALSLLSEAVLGAKNQPDEVARFASKMQSEAKRLSELVQEIIDLSRLQSSDPLQKAFVVSVDEIIREAASQAQVSSESRNITLDIGEIEDLSVVGDRSQLIVATHNLIENAINYSPDNTKVSITANRKGEVVEISVADQGIGIPEHEINRIFERFYRVDPARSRQTGGTGLGLSIVKHVALNHGGDVKVWSKVGVGSTFSLLLPATTQGLGARQ